MTGLWFPPATVDPIAGHNGAGLFLTGNPKIVHHITAGSSYAGARGAYAATGNLPHFTTSNVGGVFRVWQHLPVDVAATALVHPFGTPETNRAHAIQIEHVAPSLDSVRSWPAGHLDGIGMLCRWIEVTVGVLRRADYPFDSPPRLSWMQWGSAVGHLGHCHVPANDHMDPGPIDIGRILNAGQPAPAPAPASPSPPVAPIASTAITVEGTAAMRLVYQVPVDRVGSAWPGCGHLLTDIDFDRVLDTQAQSPVNPATDGRYRNPVADPVDENGKLRISLVGADPSAPAPADLWQVPVIVTVAD